MLEIKITDPQNLDTDTLNKVAAFFQSLVENKISCDEINPPSEPEVTTPVPLPLVPSLQNNERAFPQSVAPTPPLPAPVEFLQDSGVELDTNGMPWDGRIHSREKTKMKNGAWKPKRNVAKDTVSKVETQLNTVLAAPTPSVAVPPPPPVFSGAISFPQLMDKITGLVNEKKITSARIQELARSIGVESLAVLPVRPDLIPQVSAAIDAEIMVGA